ncbi:bifunctional demethylmenaquinone methyltransferase/2-methoxy-6-polyprenyl-1,4-benzoquinol methylase UbiE [uncultured Desulfobacter sp.]|uniref:bifunctional demethylmenaquinone methyltransferase/2-methoxy-6-polyprenyl-1,4-benzoquinol methylase UbiE n=1 Tax=uncultured Desulfobacter sp. TaxID=240139 RepID=UPI002AA621DE|nr:bifunctional demethylmenaquinone methyltransferase/2-methoxy-6-polyprenyl-1,4-benzoquinol methylase UbiE [uncultured Desulfobacter sp.]
MNQELDFVKEMFDKIAPKYDFLNRLLSMRQDVYWRREMVKAAKLESGAEILDAACGTCDVGLEVSRTLKGRASITGLDFSFGMLALGRKKLNCPAGRAIALVNGDALTLPIKNQQFDAGFMAFGIRNIMNRIGAMKEFHRTLKPGGRIIILELTTPQKGVMRKLYLLYFQKILPLIGSFFSKHGNAYAYLPESVLKFPDPVSFASQMKRAGFKQIRFKEMTLGIVTLFVGTKL